jgi:S-adenosylmethionine synthetase
MPRETIFVSESVTPGHPDKLCDQISDAAVDAFLRQDERAHLAVECAIATGIVFLAARFAAEATVDMSALARTVIADAGYTDDSFNARTCSILANLTARPASERAEAEPALDDDAAIEAVVAGEQANLFGYACRETEEFMPLPISLAHRLARQLDRARREDADFLAPDGKTQAAVEYRGGSPTRIRAITVTTAVAAHAPKRDVLVDAIRKLVVEPAFANCPIAPDAATELHVNPEGPYVVGGPAFHAGLTGRKNGIDTYGEFARQSGAALSGKDPSRVDRIGAYATRHAAKNIVAAHLAERCEVHLAYSIGQARPISLNVETFGTGRVADEEIAARLERAVDFRPAAIARRFALRTAPRKAGRAGFYRRLAVFGQVGRSDIELPWELIDIAEALKA